MNTSALSMIPNRLSSSEPGHEPCGRRLQCVDLAPIEPGMTVCDLMSGMGECWPLIARKLGRSGRIVGIDFSAEMCDRAEERRRRLPVEATVLEEDVLDNSVGAASIDCVVSAFGLETLSEGGKERLAGEVRRILEPGGGFSLLEISVPPRLALRAPYMAYLRHGVPLFGRAFLGNPDNYRLLGEYTERFRDVSRVAELFRGRGLEVRQESLFFGCATAIHGRKPT